MEWFVSEKTKALMDLNFENDQRFVIGENVAIHSQLEEI